MTILLDECLPIDFRHSFPGHEAHSVQWAGLKGKSNGELIEAAEIAGYDILLTVDQGIPLQKAFGNRKLAIIVIRSRSWRIWRHLCQPVLKALESIRPGQMVVVPALA